MGMTGKGREQRVTDRNSDRLVLTKMMTWKNPAQLQ